MSTDLLTDGPASAKATIVLAHGAGAPIREPASAAWIVTLDADAARVRQRAADVERVITHYDYERLHYCTFFWVESAWWRLQDATQ